MELVLVNHRCMNVMCAVVEFKGIKHVMPFNHCPCCHLPGAWIPTEAERTSNVGQAVNVHQQP